jgi:hypothetical protein
MLRLLRKNKLSFKPSSQTHCDEITVEQWMCENANDAGDINDVCVECFGRTIPVSNVSQAYIIAAIFAADHNDYVSKNLSYPIESKVCTSPRTQSDIDSSNFYCQQEDESYYTNELWKVEDASYEQNEDLTVNDFGPSHRREHEW